MFHWLVFTFLCLLGYIVRPVSRNERIIAALMLVLLVLMFLALLGIVDPNAVRHG